MIKLIVTDIDGTLVEDGANTLPEGMVETIIKLMEKGIIFTAASGRSLISLERLFDPIKEKIYYAACNGTLTGRYHDLMFTEAVDRKLLNEMIADIREIKGAVPFLTGADTMYSDSKNQELLDWLIRGYREEIICVPDLTKVPGEFVKLSVYDEEKNAAQKFKAFCEKWNGKVSTATAGLMWLDVYQLGMNKGVAVRKLQNYFGITPEETLAFGDQQNDIEMMKAAEYSYAIGNALPEVKQAARFVADTNVNGGALKVFKSLL